MVLRPDNIVAAATDTRTDSKRSQPDCKIVKMRKLWTLY
jgi:hypothetical protein